MTGSGTPSSRVGVTPSSVVRRVAGYAGRPVRRRRADAPWRVRGSSGAGRSPGGVAGGGDARRSRSTSSGSPRSPGSIPAARSAASARAGEPAQPASAARSVLRRWANAASTTAKTSRGAPVGAAAVPGGSARPARSRRWAPARTPPAAPSRPGATVGVPGAPSPTARRTCGSRAGRPAGRRPRPAPSPARAAAWAALQQVQQHRHRDVVRQVRDQRGRRRVRQRGPAAARRRPARSSRPARSGRARGDRPRQRRRPAPGRSRPRSPARPRRAARGSASRARARPRARRRPVELGGARRCGAPCWGRARSSARAPWSAAAELGGERADLRRPEQRRRHRRDGARGERKRPQTGHVPDHWACRGSRRAGLLGEGVVARHCRCRRWSARCPRRTGRGRSRDRPGCTRSG